MTAAELERALKDLPRIGTLIKSRPYRQVWRIVLDDQPYYLKFYPRSGARLKRLVRGNPAMREFTRLQWLQKAAVPAPRAVAVLVGFRISQQLGDLVVLQGIEPSESLEHYLRKHRGADHRALAAKLSDLLQMLGQAKLGHADLHLGNIILCQDQLYLLDAYAIRRGGLRTGDLLHLAHAAAPFATRTDLLRAWRRLAPGAPLPRTNRIAPALRRRWLQKIWGPNRYFGRTRLGPYNALFFAFSKSPTPWSSASGLTVSAEDWQRAWPALFADLQADRLPILKRSRSGDVLSATIALAGQPVPVILKRPRRRYWYRYFNEIGRGSRARRAWGKAWSLLAREVPTAWPLLLLEQRTAGYVTDAIIVFERVPGEPLSALDLTAVTDRPTLFQRLGQTLRKLERAGLYHWDAKASNFIIHPNLPTGPLPVLVDVDGIRSTWGVGEGMRRLLLSLREHPQYTPADSYALCRGYAPFAKVTQAEKDA